ncbi:hypothetical protein L484_027931 [Morus notabilis]|uniref:Uncharacterized protein n=1 Tax=Morus notabilis TaxID=981085 RepID=W9S7L7_9ROSA|nr:50S ribosomal protein 5, chloroplastic [Morus notabilis]EXC30756.1 hypothetical protein L484_027931 [Morus notabilis]
MALVVCFTPVTASPLSASSSSSSSSFLSATAIPTISRLQIKPIDLHPNSFSGVRLQMPFVVSRSCSVVVKASSESSEALSDGKEEAVSVDKLPLESKLQERLEQKLKMKLAKKIRLRRKRLVRKRRLRKKGRWPPSKMKKLKNV